MCSNTVLLTREIVQIYIHVWSQYCKQTRKMLVIGTRPSEVERLVCFSSNQCQLTTQQKITAHNIVTHVIEATGKVQLVLQLIFGI